MIGSTPIRWSATTKARSAGCNGTAAEDIPMPVRPVNGPIRLRTKLRVPSAWRVMAPLARPQTTNEYILHNHPLRGAQETFP